MVIKGDHLFTNKLRLLSIIFITSAIIAVGAFFYFNYEENSIHTVASEQLKSIADLKISQISSWNKERLTDAQIFSKNPFFVDGIEKWFASGKNEKLKYYLKKDFSLINESRMYSDVFIANDKGLPIISLKSDVSDIDTGLIFYIKAAVKNKKILMSNLYYCKVHDTVHLDYIAPIFGKNDKIIASLVLRVDPEQYLYPLINEWPVPTKTAETLIVMREQDSVVYLNNLAYQKNNRLNYKLPLSKKEVLAVKAISGDKGIVEASSYHNTKILAYIKSIPGTPWTMIAQEDESEIYAGLYFREIVIVSFTILLILVLSLALIWYYHYRQRNIFQNLFMKEKELREYHEEFKTILYSIGDGVITTDTNGNVKQMNFVAEELTGWKESEALNKSIEEVFEIIREGTNEKVQNPVFRVLKEGVIVGLANHTLLISKLGKQTPIADSGAPVRNEDGEIEGVVLVFRDKTEEHKSEKLIRQSEARLERAELASKSGNWELHLGTQMIIASVGAEQIYELDKEEFDYETIKEFPLHEYRPLLDNALHDLLNNNIPYDIEFKIRGAKTGKLKDIHSIGIFDKETNILFGAIQDITDRKKIEEELKASESFSKNLLETIPLPVFYKDKYGHYLGANKSFITLFNYTEKELNGKTVFDLYPKELAEIYNEKDSELLHSGGTQIYESQFQDRNGILHEVIIHKAAYENSENEINGLIGAILDISERKEYERNIKRQKDEFERIFNLVPAQIWYKDTENRCLRVNKQVCEDLGLKKDEIEDHTAEELFPEYAEAYLKDDLEVIESRKPKFGIIEKIRNASGEIRQLQTDKVPVFNDNGDVDGVIAFVLDITEKAKSEEVIRVSNERWESLFNNSPDAVAIYKAVDDGENFVFTDFNLSAERLDKMNRESVIGKKITELFPATLELGFLEVFKRVLDTGKTEKMNVKFYKDNRIQGWRDNIIYKLNTGEIVAIYKDVSEKMKAELALKESERRFRTTLYSIGDAVIATNKQGNVKQMNHIAESLTGWKEADAKDKHLEEIFNIINEGTREKVESPVHKVLKEGKIVGLANHTLLISKNGTEIPIADSGAPIKDENGEINGVVLVFRDQEKEREVQKAIEESEFQLRQSQRVAQIGYYVYDLTKGTWTSSQTLDEIFGIDDKYVRNVEGWINLIHPDYRDELAIYLENHIVKSKNEFNKEYKIVKYDDAKTLWVHGLGKLEFDKNGNLLRMFGTIQDITKHKEAQDIIENSLREKDILIKEIHHRVKNNFQQIISLISLQTENITDEQVIGIFSDLQSRLLTMSLIHELMYRSENFVGVDIKDYIERLTSHLLNTSAALDRIKVNLNLESHKLDLDSTIPCGLLINEIITNSIKYAFPNNANGIIDISFKKENDIYSLKISDDGIGIKNDIDFENISSLGLRLINLLTKQLRGTLEVIKPKSGIAYVIKFKGDS